MVHSTDGNCVGRFDSGFACVLQDPRSLSSPHPGSRLDSGRYSYCGRPNIAGPLVVGRRDTGSYDDAAWLRSHNKS